MFYSGYIGEILTFRRATVQEFGKRCGKKGGNAGIQRFSSSPTMFFFSLLYRPISTFGPIVILHLFSPA